MERIIFMPGEKVSLVIPEKKDLEIMYKAINNLDLIKYIGSVRHNTLESEEKFLNSILDNREIFYMIMLNDTKEIIGSIGFNEYNKESRNGIIGIILYDEEKMSKGYGSEAMKLFLKYVFDFIGIHKVILQVFTNNPRAIASYKKVGFKEVGVLKENVYIMGKYEDEMIMEILRKDWINYLKNER